MNPFEMVILIVLIVTIGSVIRGRRAHHRDERIAPEERVETLRLQEEVKQLKERIHVLERIATDKNDTLSREIDQLRDR